MYGKVPICTPVRVPLFEMSRAMPKSSTLMVTAPIVLPPRITFSGLRSRCTTGPGSRTAWAAATAEQTASKIDSAAVVGGCRPAFKKPDTHWWSDTPSTHSITM
ncbi:MAG: hypothetical protein R3A52_12600 [Polyangiales bacterium]